MKKRKIPWLLLLGIGLILVSLVFLAVSQIRVHLGAKQSVRVVGEMERLLPESSLGVPGQALDGDMPALEIAGTDYAALLEISACDVQLPVAYHWESNRLYRSPARYSGSAYTGDLVIGGADSSRQFGFCDQIENGTTVTLTDMTGANFTYQVTGVERSRQAQNQWLMDENSDLTLFCRDAQTLEYIAVRCNYAYH